ncbi:MAG TPA: ABC transporter ATP-binding protein [Planctomycetota bacterium]|nr:ABC transporter ATP-binding protein [Planctomycetota bacterium]
MTEPAVSVERYSLRLGDREVLRDLTFSIPAGDWTALIGPNGAGKTTLLKALLRILRGGRGGIRIAGVPLDSYSQFDLARRLAYVPQGEGRSAPFTVREMVEMARYPHRGPLAPLRPEDRSEIDRALQETGMSGFSSRSMDALSGGERQKALLAAALAQQSEILLLDEPTAFLDPSQQADVLGVLGRAHREKGMTIVAVTHDLNEALTHARRVIALREGAVVFDGPSADLTSGDVLRRIYDHDFVIGTHPKTGRPVLFPE